MAETIMESGMNFIADNALYIEKSPQYDKVNQNVQSAEFVQIREGDLMENDVPQPSNKQ